MNRPDATTPLTAVVTGASRGIGLAVAERLLACGYRILSCSRGPLNNRGKNWTHLQADLSAPAGIEALLSHSWAINTAVLVNNVGAMYSFSGLDSETPDVWSKTFATNLFGPIECCRRLAPVIATERGAIVNIASIYGPISVAPAILSYTASKAALESVTRSLAVELSESGVRVNAILPGNIDTEMTQGAGQEYIDAVVRRTPLRKLGTVDDIAEAVEFLAHSSFITGHSMVIDGGVSLVGG